MSLTDISIKRPVLTLMMTLSMVVFGMLGYYELGVDQMPNMEFPVVTVIAQLEGASPETMEEDVTELLEEQLNTIAGVRKLRSRSRVLKRTSCIGRRFLPAASPICRLGISRLY